MCSGNQAWTKCAAVSVGWHPLLIQTGQSWISWVTDPICGAHDCAEQTDSGLAVWEHALERLLICVMMPLVCAVQAPILFRGIAQAVPGDSTLVRASSGADCDVPVG